MGVLRQICHGFCCILLKTVLDAIWIDRQKARETADERELCMSQHRVAAKKYRDANWDAINVHQWARSAR